MVEKICNYDINNTGPLYIDYDYLYNCTFQSHRVLFSSFLLVWIVYLVNLLGSTASNYFSPTLGSISIKLNLSYTIAGVTFLAFGNGAPDVFSSFAAVVGDSEVLVGLGALLGASMFVSTIIVGIISIMTTLQVSKDDFLRDIIFHILAIVMITIAVFLTYVPVVLALAYITLYIVYSVFVIYSSLTVNSTVLLQSLNNEETQDDNCATYSNTMINMESNCIYQDGYEMNTTNSTTTTTTPINTNTNTYDPILLNKSTNTDITLREEQGLIEMKNNTQPHTHTHHAYWYPPLITNAHINTITINSIGCYSVKNDINNHHLSNSPDTIDTNTQPLDYNTKDITENELHPLSISTILHPHPVVPMMMTSSVVSSSSLERPHSYSPLHHIQESYMNQHQYVVSPIPTPINDPTATVPSFSSSSSSIPYYHSTSLPNTLKSHSGYNSNNNTYNTHSKTDTHTNATFGIHYIHDTIFSLSNYLTSSIKTREQKYKAENTLSECLLDHTSYGTDLSSYAPTEYNNTSTTTTATATHITMDHTTTLLNPARTTTTTTKTTTDLKYEPLVSPTAPTTTNANTTSSSASYNDSYSYSYNCLDTCLCCHHHLITPVTDTFRHYYNVQLHNIYWRQQMLRRKFSRSLWWKQFKLLLWYEKISYILNFPFILLRDLTIPTIENESWMKLYAVLQPILSVFFILYLSQNMSTKIGHIFLYVFSLLFTCPMACVIYFITSANSPPQHPVLSTIWLLYGFMMCIFWIYMFATELVTCLSAAGRVYGVPSAYLGLTVLAWGNSIGDFFSNISLTRRGFGEMALSGCYGSPIFNILFGLGLSFTYVCVKTYPTAYHLPYDVSSYISLLFIYISLGSTLLYIVCNNYTFDRYLGYYLVLLYIIYSCVQFVALVTMT